MLVMPMNTLQLQDPGCPSGLKNGPIKKKKTSVGTSDIREIQGHKAELFLSQNHSWSFLCCSILLLPWFPSQLHHLIFAITLLG